MADDDLHYLLVPGGGGSGPDHWHHRWADALPRCAWVNQTDPEGGTTADWVATIDRAITSSPHPVVLVAHSLACIAVAHWSLRCQGPVVGALLVAPADVDDDWAEPNSLYKRFQPIPMQPLQFSATVVASTNDPLLSLGRATEFAAAWSAELEVVGEHLHLGSDALLGTWPTGRRLLEQLVSRAGTSD